MKNESSTGGENIAGYEENRVIGEYLVTVKEGTTVDFLESHFSEISVYVIEKVHDDVFLIKVKEDPGPERIRDEYMDDDRIIDIQPNYRYEIKPPSGKKKARIEREK